MESPTIDPHIPGIYCLVSQLRVTCFEASGSDNALILVHSKGIGLSLRALPAIPRPSADRSPVERPRRFLNTLG